MNHTPTRQTNPHAQIASSLGRTRRECTRGSRQRSRSHADPFGRFANRVDSHRAEAKVCWNNRGRDAVRRGGSRATSAVRGIINPRSRNDALNDDWASVPRVIPRPPRSIRIRTHSHSHSPTAIQGRPRSRLGFSAIKRRSFGYELRIGLNLPNQIELRQIVGVVQIARQNVIHVDRA